MNKYRLQLYEPGSKSSFISFESDNPFPAFSKGEIIRFPDKGKGVISFIEYYFTGEDENCIWGLIIWTNHLKMEDEK
jgi:hypothetical protein